MRKNLLEPDHTQTMNRTCSSVLLFSFLVFWGCLIGTAPAKDSHHAEHRLNDLPVIEKTEQYYTDKYNIVTSVPRVSGPGGKLTKTVYGFHPFWYGTAYKDYDFSLLSTVSYFSYHVDPKTGGQQGVFFWRETPLVDIAKAAGSRVDLTITSFGSANNHLFLSNKTAQKQTIENVIHLLKKRNGDGVCIDFESIPATMQNEFTDFVSTLSQHLRKVLPEATVSLALYAIDWNHVFDIPDLIASVDQFIVMAYDYHYSSSKYAGPVAPLQSGKIWPPYNVENSVETYLAKGVPASKMLLSVPYYGQQWHTKNATFPVRNLGHIATMPYRKIVPLLQKGKEEWDPISHSQFLGGLKDEQPFQLWYNDVKSLKAKYQYVKEKGLAGIAIFALGYDSGHYELWQLIQDEFTAVPANN